MDWFIGTLSDEIESLQQVIRELQEGSIAEIDARAHIKVFLGQMQETFDKYESFQRAHKNGLKESYR